MQMLLQTPQAKVFPELGSKLPVVTQKGRKLFYTLIEDMSVKDRLVEFIEYLNMNPKSFERTYGFANGFIRNIGFSISKNSIDKLNRAFPYLNTNYILTGEGKMLKEVVTEDAARVEANVRPFTKSAITNIPNSNGLLIGEINDDHESSPFIDIGGGQYIMVVPLVPIRAQASYVEHYNDEQFINENFTQKHSFAVSRIYRGKYMAFIVDGESMDNGVAGEAIPEGYTVTGREIQKQHWRNKFHIHRYKDYVIVHKDGIFIKQIIRHDTDNGIITCHSLNPDKDQYPDFELNLDDCYQIFNVVNVTQTK